jgi:hypothetical protein
MEVVVPEFVRTQEEFDYYRRIVAGPFGPRGPLPTLLIDSATLADPARAAGPLRNRGSELSRRPLRLVTRGNLLSGDMRIPISASPAEDLKRCATCRGLVGRSGRCTRCGTSTATRPTLPTWSPPRR